MNIYEAAWLHIRSTSLTLQPRIHFTFDIVKGTNVFAKIDLSLITQGVDPESGVSGIVGAYIRRWTVYQPDGSTRLVDPGLDEFGTNAIVIENCATLTVELVGNFVEAYAIATVFSL